MSQWDAVSSPIQTQSSGWDSVSSPVNPGLFGRIGNDWQQNIADFKNIGQNGESGVERAAQGIGIYGQALSAPFAETIRSGVTALNNNTVPDAPYKVIGRGINDLYQGSDLQGMAQDTKQLYNQGAQANPRLAADANAFLNMGNSLAMVKGGLDAASGTASAVGSGLKNVGQDIIDNRKANFAKNLVMPVPTKSVLEDQVSRTTQTPILGRKIVSPDNLEQNSINAVSEIPGVSKIKSYQSNYNIISEANQKEAENLISSLKQNDVTIADDTIINALSNVRNNLAKNPYVVGGGEKAAEATVNNALDIIQKHPQTASGLLQARKEFDSFIKSQKPKIFDTASDSPVTAAVREVRQSINDLVDQAVPNTDVRASLGKQSALYNAMDNIEPKAAAEGNNRVSRFIKSTSDKIPIKNPIVKGAAEVAALGGLGTAAVTAPAAATGAAGIYLGAKALPYALKAAGFTLDNAGNLLKAGAPLTARDIGMLSPAMAMQVLNLNQGNVQ